MANLNLDSSEDFARKQRLHILRRKRWSRICNRVTDIHLGRSESLLFEKGRHAFSAINKITGLRKWLSSKNMPGYSRKPTRGVAG
jgi:hypothetical protein